MRSSRRSRSPRLRRTGAFTRFWWKATAVSSTSTTRAISRTQPSSSCPRSRTNDDYLSLNQVTVANLDGERRFDVVCYVNGMPLAFIELKKTGANTSIEGAHNQLQTYVKEFGMAFRFANIVIPSDDLSAKYGTPFTPRNHFAPWNVDEDGSPVDPNNMVMVEASRSRSWTCCLMVCLMWSVLDSSTATSRRSMTRPKG